MKEMKIEELPYNYLGWNLILKAFLLFFGLVVSMSLMGCMSYAIVAMTDSTNPDFPHYNWDKSISITILGSFYYGYILAQYPAGQLIRTRSAVNILAIGLGTSSIFLISIPWLADNVGYQAVFCCRILMGIFQSCVNPCMYTLISRWVSPLLRARFGAGILGGNYVGTIIAMFASEILADSKYGWPSIFYFFGVVGIIWGILFYSLCSDYSSESGVLRSKNVEASKDNVQNFECSTKTESSTVPWKAILTSASYWAFVIAGIGNILVFYTFFLSLPTFLQTILHYELKQIGTISSFPYIAMWLFGYPISFMADFAISKGARIALVRKICAVIGFWIPAACMIFLATIQISNTNIIICIIVIALGLNSASNCSTQINHLDLAPNFVAPITAVSNVIQNLGILGIPYLLKYVLADETQFVDQWRMLFFVSAGIYFFSNLFFLIFGRCEIQPWNNLDNKLLP